jgi:hypothetical protein
MRTCCSHGDGDIEPGSRLSLLRVKPVAPAGTLEIHIGRCVVRVDGVVDADTLRTVLGSLRS